jgi:choline dehydrogenase-like flavoprotein
VCGLCPVDSKFTVTNALAPIFGDPRVKLVTGAAVEALETRAGSVSAVIYRRNGRSWVRRAELVALGANALFNPVILARSGLAHPHLGVGLHEQLSATVEVWLGGVDNFQGSTSITGHGYMLYSGPHRRERAAALIETWNVPLLRIEPGRWRSVLRVQVIYEDLPQPHNRVRPGSEDPGRPLAEHGGPSEYALRGLSRLGEDIERVLRPLPVERIRLPRAPRATEGHMLGTTAMARAPEDGIVDGDLVHHQLRNLLVLGGGTFPTCSPSNPTLTIAALSLRAADRLVGRGAATSPPGGPS